VTLDVSGLVRGLKDLFEGTDGYPAGDAEAGQRWAEIYRAYAGAALAGPTAPVADSLQGAEARLAGALAAAFTAARAAGAASLATLTPLADAAFVSFWLGPPVAFVTPPPPAAPAVVGVVTAAPPGVLSPGLSAVLGTAGAKDATAAQQATSIAAVLDRWTRTVLVLNTPPGPPAPPVPLT
jgi:hypothetical protein